MDTETSGITDQSAETAAPDSRENPSVMRYRKKPVVIEAVQWTGANVDEVMAFCFADDRWKQGMDSEHVGGPGIGHTPPLGTLDIPTLEGTMTASAGDWIIRGVKGELYPCKPEIFEATYERADSPDPDAYVSFDDDIWYVSVSVVGHGYHVGPVKGLLGHRNWALVRDPGAAWPLRAASYLFRVLTGTYWRREYPRPGRGLRKSTAECERYCRVENEKERRAKQTLARLEQSDGSPNDG